MGPLPRRLALALPIAALAVAVFLPVAGHDFVTFDDDLYVTANPEVRHGLSPGSVLRAFTTTRAGNWHPLTWISHQADVGLFGLDAGAHHLVSLALHAANAALLFGLLAAMTGATWRPALVAALFAVHPLHVESVAWVAERKDLLAGFFGLVATAAYLHYARRPGGGRLLAVSGAFVLGLLSKPVLVTFPFVALLLDAWPLGRLRLGWRRLIGEKAPLLVLAAVSSALTYAIQKAQGALAGPLLGPGDRAANALLSYAAYLGKVLWPAGLSFFYPYREALSPVAVAAAGLLLAAVTAATFALARRLPFLLVGWLWYLGTLVPMIGLVQVGGQAMADRYTYPSLTGVFVAAAWGIGALPRGARRLATPAAAAAVALLAVLAREQVGVWRDDLSLYGHALAIDPANHVALTNLGHAKVLAGSLEEAVAAFDRAIALRPAEWRPRLGRAEALAGLGRLDEAEGELREALELRPDAAEARNYLGVVLLRRGRPEEASAQFVAALELAPAYADPLNNLGAAALALGRSAEAEGRFRQALAERPDYPEAHHGLGIALVRQGRLGEGIVHLREAVRLRPGYAAAAADLAKALRLPAAAPREGR